MPVAVPHDTCGFADQPQREAAAEDRHGECPRPREWGHDRCGRAVLGEKSAQLPHMRVDSGTSLLPEQGGYHQRDGIPVRECSAWGASLGAGFRAHTCRELSTRPPDTCPTKYAGAEPGAVGFTVRHDVCRLLDWIPTVGQTV
jgi:hypothetical protein